MRSPRLLLASGLCVCLATASMFSAEPAAATMAGAATKFLASLTPEQKQKAQFAFDSDERTHWHFIPTGQAPAGFPRNGLTIKDMQPPQRALAHALLKTGLSQHGYLTATQIMELESTLGAIEKAAATVGPSGAPTVRDPERYFFSVFGTPTAKGTWGWRVEGHHVSLQFTVVNGSTNVSTPTFFGSNPAEVREGPNKGLRVLGFEEDPARTLITSLSPAQRQKALLAGDAPRDIVTGNRYPIEPLAPAGILLSALDAAQRQTLLGLIQAYMNQMAPDIAAERNARLQKAGIDRIAFAWAGETERGKKHYYRVQGPTFLIEYDNTQNDGNHVHSVWRDFNGDFGRDLLREHVQGVKHE
jgi:hypothetical protein